MNECAPANPPGTRSENLHSQRDRPLSSRWRTDRPSPATLCAAAPCPKPSADGMELACAMDPQGGWSRCDSASCCGAASGWPQASRRPWRAPPRPSRSGGRPRDARCAAPTEDGRSSPTLLSEGPGGSLHVHFRGRWCGRYFNSRPMIKSRLPCESEDVAPTPTSLRHVRAPTVTRSSGWMEQVK